MHPPSDLWFVEVSYLAEKALGAADGYHAFAALPYPYIVAPIFVAYIFLVKLSLFKFLIFVFFFFFNLRYDNELMYSALI